jgi:hypothetical protein
MAISDDIGETVASSKSLPFTSAQLVPLTIFCLIVVIFGILGNGTVLYSSARYNAIRLDRVSLILVQNLAVADILYTICVILPQLITYIAGKWVLGKVYCFIAAQISFLPGSANALTVLLITTYRVWLVTHPFFSVPKTVVRIVVVFSWFLASAGTVISLAYKSSSTFNPGNAKCMSGVYENIAASAILKIALAVIVIIPLFVITIENAVLCMIAVKSSRRQNVSKANYKALVMVCSLSGLFIISWVPYIIYTFMKSKNPEIPQALDLLAFHCIYLNSFGNPILYTLTNKRFGTYVKDLLYRAFCGLCGQKTSIQDLSGVNPTSSTNAKSAELEEQGKEVSTKAAHLVAQGEHNV